jgi:phosphopantothenoylcysteine decarboxylase/phosphopantothenate--cysteine ligase
LLVVEFGIQQSTFSIERISTMARIALGVTGGIGAYKAVEIVRLLQQRGHDVTAVMTRSARRFVGPVTFEAITRHPVITNQFAPGVNSDIEHIALASEIDLLVVAPATANIIGKFANGIADDFLSSLYLATRAPVLVAPAMNTNMLAHEAVQKNLAALAARGVRFVEPGEGYLACGWIGKGRLAEPAEVAAAADALVRPAGSLVGRTVLVTAGPTYEDLDPVRYVGNRSSGRMGFALAAEAARRGARVWLVSGPTEVPPPAGPELVRVRSAAEMRDAVASRAPEADAVIMAAAVADYTPEQGRAGAKLQKDDDRLTIRLVRTPDILAELGARRAGNRPILVGFAAETGPAEARAREKLRAKNVDLVVANDVSRPDAGFEVTTNVATLVTRDGDEALPLQSKAALAGVILDRVETMLAAGAKSQAPRRDESPSTAR